MTAPKRPLSILAFSPYLPYPPDHGGRIRTFLLLRALARLGHRVSLVVLLGDDDAGRDVAGLKSAGIDVVTVPQARRFGDQTFADRLRKLGNLVRGRSDVLARYWSDPALAAARAAGPVDVVIAEALWTAPLALALDAPARVLNAHNVESVIAERIAASTVGRAARALAEREARGLRRDEVGCVRGFDAVAVVSEEDRCELSRRAPEAHMTVVGNCVDTETLQPLPAPVAEAPRCLFIGSANYAPNVTAVKWFVEQVFPQVRERHPDARFQVVGADPPERWRRLAATHAGVELLGYVENVADAYRGATQVVVPIHVGGGTRLKILEALALGRPVVATTIGAEGLGLDHQRHALIADDPKEFASSIDRLHGDAALLERITGAGREHVEAVGSASVLGGVFEALIREAHARATEGR